MGNNVVVITVLRFILLILAQVTIFNQMNFMGFVNPLIYVLFFYWYPIRANTSFFLMIGFLLGFFIDLFSDTMALHATASITMAYARPFCMRLCFGNNFDIQTFTFKNTTRLQRITFLFMLILIQHTVFFTLEILSFSHILLILKKILFTSFATLVLSVLLSSLFARAAD